MFIRPQWQKWMKMDLSLSKSSSTRPIFTRVHEVSKDRLFFDQWKYSARFKMVYVHLLRGRYRSEPFRSIQGCKSTLFYLEFPALGLTYQQDIFGSFYDKEILAPSKRKNQLAVLSDIMDKLTLVRDYAMTKEKTDCKFMLSRNTLMVYTNELKIIEELHDLGCFITGKLSVAVVNRPKNTVLLKKHREYKYRTYFKFAHLSQENWEGLQTFCKNYKEYISASPSMIGHLALANIKSAAIPRMSYRPGPGRANTVYDSFFIDHTNTNVLTILQLLCPGVVRKTLDILSPAK